MPPKIKTNIHSVKARASKQKKEGESESEGDTSAAEPSTLTIQETSEDPTLKEGDVEVGEEYDFYKALYEDSKEMITD